MKQLTMALLAPVIFSSCLQVRDKEKPNPSTPQSPEVVAMNGDFQLVPTPEINRYMLRLKPGMSFVSESHPNAELIFTGGESVTGHLTNGAESKPISFEVPKDLYLNQVISSDDFRQGLVLPHPKKSGEFVISTPGRLRLGPEFRMFIGANKVTLMANTLEFEDAKISSFESGVASSPTGRSAGTLTLHAQRATGRVLISLPGERGQTGQNAPANPGRAPQGANNSQKIDEYNSGGFHGDQPWDGTCPKASGGVGGTGAKGYRGSSGGNGGKAGTLKVSIGDSKGLQVSYSAVGGAGGFGGDGGPGQMGGMGGSPGKMRVKHHRSGKTTFETIFTETIHPCPGGEEGAVGPAGDKGAEGSAGEAGSFCVADGEEWKCQKVEKGGIMKFAK